MGLRIEILNKSPSEEKQQMKRSFEPQMRLISFYESQIQSKIAEQNTYIVHIDMVWDVGGGTDRWIKKQEPQAQETLEELKKANKQLSINVMEIQQLGVGQSPWTIVWLDELFGTAREGTGPVKHKTEIEITNHQKPKDSPSNINQPSELDYILPELELKLNFEC
ncbi:MAG: hypothetical protein EZS28_051692 [Streblomastix strix]|uniref:Uncharacterized protein n=1 Tax=Streblomastix strix TaxID=222440 RepID=A0A5J4T4U5_9EUKA|nr:MAG: hypothetical protein EZS28_051692 [Streblomastix strix]